MHASVWTEDYDDIRVVLTGPIIRVGVSDSRGIKRNEGGAKLLSK